ncbi:YuiB family protein [Paenibacillus sp. N1-5-1-14]|uniref:YuiB family protein n=1 Tax=Paenibacillus radicibacter TaxID=2972488 RepID=UPI002158BF71|nr:YuiB family protein [Paenibacillus radicibacter]MCR8645256.1 YuiB family protein [Paenibacillus radicibacter]
MIQTFIVIVLMFVLFFGLGFILNMLIKTTWLPMYMFIALIIGLLIYQGWGDFAGQMSKYGAPDYLAAIGGLAGAFLSGKTIDVLRIRGFKMF